MDLIYTDAQNTDLGIIKYYELDLAFGTDENNFELRMSLDQHCMEIGSYIGIYDTEYGGIVDGIAVDTKNNEVIYTGRTWQGLLSSIVIYPSSVEPTLPANIDYRIVDGNTADIISDIIYQGLGANSPFNVVEGDEIDAVTYQFERYIDAYTGLLKFCKVIGGKLKFNVTYKEGVGQHKAFQVDLGVFWSVDHTEIDDFEDTQLDFVIGKNRDFPTHLICLGGGDMRDRYIIHLFTDENGKIQPYTTVDEPTKDTDYITNGSPISIANERAEVLDYPNAEVVENYAPLDNYHVKPSDWDSSQINNYEAEQKGLDYDPIYYKRVVDDNGEVQFEEVKAEEVEGYVEIATQPNDYIWYNMVYNGEVYENVQEGQEYVWKQVEFVKTYQSLQTKPADWETNYRDYYRYYGGVYERVRGDPTTVIRALTKKPDNWEKKFSIYLVSDGQGGYTNVTGDSVDTYSLLTSRPSLWDTEYGNYYYKTTIWKKKKVNKKWQYYKDKDGWLSANKYFDQKTHEEKTVTTAPPWKPKKYYAKSSKTVAPKFRVGMFYGEYTVTFPPTFHAFYYGKYLGELPPAWEASRYYTIDSVVAPEAFWSTDNLYYRKVYDHYAELVKAGIEHIEEKVAKASTFNTDLKTSEKYDILDMVGATEKVTGLSVKAYVLKKIVKLTERTEDVSYEIGTEVQ